MNDKLINEMVFRNVGFAAVRGLSFSFYRKAQVSRKGCLRSLLFVMAFFVFALPISAQPTMSRGEQLLPISYDECMKRAENAFNNEGWVNIGKGGAFVTAFKENHGAYIMCNVAPENKIWVNIVVASSSQNNNVPGAERVKLQERMNQSGSGNLAGDWESSYQGTWKPTTIRQEGNKLWFTNEFGNTSAGFFESSTRVKASDWEGGLGATIQDANTIKWDNGSVWRRRR